METGMQRKQLWRIAAMALLAVVSTAAFTHLGIALWRYFTLPAPSPPIDTPLLAPQPAPPPPAPLTLGTYAPDLHPDARYGPYFTGAPSATDPIVTAPLLLAFQALLTQYTLRQAVDDNFTIRIYDTRTGRELTRYELTDWRQRYVEQGSMDWDAVDRVRREITRNLLDHFAARGHARSTLQARWGRATQVKEAFQRALPYLEYEIRLARSLNLSLLSTAVGVVETFNDDRQVSPAGARSRYQLMPYLLRQYGIHHYKLPTAYGNTVQVAEEWHPLLTMEPAFLVMRAYTNAVGHEIPGLSAYHTGPANLFRIYRAFLTEGIQYLRPSATVVDAFVWALTEGFSQLSASTSFRNYSRGYVPSLYGTVRALEHLPLDTSHTVQAELVQVVTKQPFYLSDLLRALQQAGGDTLDWHVAAKGSSLYHRFRLLNPHFQLPSAAQGGVPPNGDIRFVSSAQQPPIRLFLPLGATERLEAIGFTGLELLRRYDHQTYHPEELQEVTNWDQTYALLVEEISHFGFTRQNRALLDTLVVRFETLAAQQPTPYRLRQLQIIRTHARLWRFDAWEQLAQAAEAATGRLRLPARPPENALSE